MQNVSEKIDPTGPTSEHSVNTPPNSTVTFGHLEQLFEKLLKRLSPIQTAFTEEEAAEYCRVSVETIRYHALRSRKLSWTKLSKNQLTFLKRDLDAFLENCRVETSRDQ